MREGNERLQNTKRSLFRRIAWALTHRLFFDILFILLQIGVLALMVLYFARYFVYFYAACILLTVAAVIWIVASRSHPDYKIAWIIPILALPVFGGLLFLLFGGGRVPRRFRLRMQRMDDLQRQELREPVPRPELEEGARVQSRYISRVSLFPPGGHTATTYYPLGEDLFAGMLEELERAERYIFLQYFTIQEGEMWDAILAILERKAAAGLDVRVIYDDLGCLITLPKRYARTLRDKGIACKVFNPFRPVATLRLNNRDHRKICVIDGHTAFTGGVNLSDEYINRVERFGHWKDSGIRVKGAAAWNLAVMFLSTWCISEEDADFTPYRPDPEVIRAVPDDGLVQPFSDTPLDSEAVSATVYENLIARANRYVYITTPYLIIDHAMTEALRTAARSGVDVRLIVPHIPDKRRVFELTRAHYVPLVEAGVKVYEYLPGFIHSKTIVADDKYGVVGTINLDYRSLYLHFECGVWLYGTRSVADIREDFLATQAVSQQVRREEVARLSWGKRLYRSLLRIFAPML